MSLLVLYVDVDVDVEGEAACVWLKIENMGCGMCVANCEVRCAKQGCEIIFRWKWVRREIDGDGASWVWDGMGTE